jgi:glyoxylase-like metal-dependent hydrolase (beta-lactamase superfamily II)
VCYLDDDGTLYAGDACGVRIAPNALVLPPTPPPDVDVAAWAKTLDEIERRAPFRIALIHFGVFDDVERHLAELRARLFERRDFVAAGVTEDEFAQRVRDGVANTADEFHVYERAMPLWQSYSGLKRYVERLTPSPSPASGAA